VCVWKAEVKEEDEDADDVTTPPSSFCESCSIPIQLCQLQVEGRKAKKNFETLTLNSTSFQLLLYLLKGGFFLTAADAR